MGLPLHNIHDPTVASSSGLEAGQHSKDDVPIMDLIKQKDELEAEMSALGSVLESHRATMSTSLLTFDGFPRSDIDVAQIRTTRARIIRLQNDHKAVMARIEPKLHEYFAARREEEEKDSAASTSVPAAPSTSSTNASSNPPTSSATTSRTTQELQREQTAPQDNQPPSSQETQDHSSATSLPPATTPAFALVNTVSPSSPAEEAGLISGDRVQRFGDADWSNNDKLARVARIVGMNEGRGIEVVVVRHSDINGASPGNAAGSGEGSVHADGERQVRVTLVPRSGWGGRGSIGCHLLPL